MSRNFLSLAALFLTVVSAPAQQGAALKVAALHPLMADLARQVGGKDIELVPLMTANDDPHHFSPTPAALQRAAGAKLYLASGMGLETYLGKLRDTLGGGAVLVEVGKSLPARPATGADCGHDHGHDHDHRHDGHADPHWWHDIRLMQRAADVVAKAFATADPARAAAYRQRARAYRAELAKLDGWVRRELVTIPRANRKLVTAHASFNYFCAAYGFEALSLKGINKGSDPSAQDLAEIIRTIRSKGIKAVFPEQRANPKALQTLSKETGARIGGNLIADGSSSYTAMMRHNVRTIVKALKPTP